MLMCDARLYIDVVGIDFLGWYAGIAGNNNIVGNNNIAGYT